MDICVCVCFELSWVRTDLATDQSLIHEVLKNVYMIQNPGKRQQAALVCRPTAGRDELQYG